MDDDRLARLEARVAELESRFVVAPRSEARAAIAASVPSEPRESTPPEPHVRTAGSIEALVAGRGLQAAGLVLVLLGVAFFLELAFTRGWIGPAERIVLGLVAGSALIAIANRRTATAYRGLGDALIALGAGIVDLSLWASVALFPELNVSRYAALFAMIALTASIGALANARRSERLAFLAVLAGFATPTILSATLEYVTLGAYLIVLTAFALALALRRAYLRLDVLTLLGVAFYAWEFAPNAAAGWTEVDAAAFATTLFLVFAGAATFGCSRAGATPARVAFLAIDYGGYAVALALIFADRQHVLGSAYLALAAVTIGVAQIRQLPAIVSRTFGYLGLAAITFALPAFFNHSTLLQAFTVEALAMFVLGMRGSDVRLARAGAVAFAIVGAGIVVDSLVEETQAGVSVTLGYAIWLAGGAFVLRRYDELTSGEHPGASDFARLAFDVVALAGLSRVCLDLFGGSDWHLDVTSRGEFALSLAWTGFATWLFARGLRTRDAFTRWEGLALFAATIVKVFAVDLSNVDVELRIGSFVVLGIVLFVVSAMYTRAMKRSGDA